MCSIFFAIFLSLAHSFPLSLNEITSEFFLWMHTDRTTKFHSLYLYYEIWCASTTKPTTTEIAQANNNKKHFCLNWAMKSNFNIGMIAGTQKNHLSHQIFSYDNKIALNKIPIKKFSMWRTSNNRKSIYVATLLFYFMVYRTLNIRDRHSSESASSK